MRKRCASLAMIATLAAGFVTIAAPPALALTSVETCFYNAINKERASAGRSKLAVAGDLVAIARRHSRWMAEDGTIYHANSTSPHYREGDNYQAELHGNYNTGGENVGMGGDCKSIHDAFMASHGHKENILDRTYNQVGVGVAYDDEGTVYVTEDFVGRRSATPRRVVSRRPAPAHPAARRTVPRPVAKVVQAAEPRTVPMLLMLIGLDARRVDGASGEALGV